MKSLPEIKHDNARTVEKARVITIRPISRRDLGQLALLCASAARDDRPLPPRIVAKVALALIDFQDARRVLMECLGDACAMGSHCIDALGPLIPDDQDADAAVAERLQRNR